MPSCCDVLKSLSSPDLELLCYIVMRYPFFANDNLQKVLCLNYGVTTDVSTAYHPQTIYSWTGGGFILMVLKRILERIVEKTKEDSWTQDKNLVFNVGDRVLLFNSRLKIFSGKLKTRWTGPFTVAQVFPYGTVELSQTDGPKFKDLSRFLKPSCSWFSSSFTRASHLLSMFMGIIILILID
ncbi:hypothetical protein Tco_1420484 [Tanacetum coccineum]